jgi:thiamine biosynthesis protein ThiS
MMIVLNGAPLKVEGSCSIADLLQDRGIDRRSVAVELNLVIVAKSMYDKTEIQTGDRLEIVQFVGGG